MRPAQRPKIADKEYVSNSDFWGDVLNERITAERTVRLRGFNVFDWVPRNPGLYHTPDAEWARKEAQFHVRGLEPRAFREYFDSDGAPPDAASGFSTTGSG